MSHHNNQEFPGVLIDEMDRILVQIRQINDQAEALISRARDIAALAKRTVSENVKVHLESMKAEDRIRQAQTIIDREAQREVERQEQEIDNHREASRARGIKAFAAHLSASDGCGANLMPRSEDMRGPRPGIFMGSVISDHQPDESDGADERLAFDVVPADGEDLARGGEPPMVGMTLEQAALEFVRGTIAAQTQIDESPAVPPAEQEMDTGAADAVSPQPAEAAPVDTNSTRIEIATIRDNSVRSMWPGLNEHAAADEPTVPAGDAHDEAPAADTFEVDTGAGYMVVATIEDGRVKYLGPKNMAEPEQESAEKKGPAETAAEEAKVIPPEDSSAVDVSSVDAPMGSAALIIEGGNVTDRRKPDSTIHIEPDVIAHLAHETAKAEPTQDAIDAAARERQNANVREAEAFTDKVLDLWNSTLLTEAQIAKRLGKTKGLIATVIEQARSDQDPRIMGKRGIVPKLPKETLPLSAVARKIMERPAPSAAVRAGVELGEFKPLAPEPDRVEKDLSKGVCIVDLRTNRIYGKRGMWTTDEARARTVAFLNGGQMFPKDVIAQRCGWTSGRDFLIAITPMIERLRDIGIVMTSTLAGVVIRADD